MWEDNRCHIRTETLLGGTVALNSVLVYKSR